MNSIIEIIELNSIIEIIEFIAPLSLCIDCGALSSPTQLYGPY